MPLVAVEELPGVIVGDAFVKMLQIQGEIGQFRGREGYACCDEMGRAACLKG